MVPTIETDRRFRGRGADLPLYEYECVKCKHRFERIQKFSDPPADKCPECGAKVEQLISAPALQFKGSGWYVTDYAKKGSGGSSGNKQDGGSGESKSESKSESKTESKSESTSDSKSDSKKDRKSSSEKKS